MAGPGLTAFAAIAALAYGFDALAVAPESRLSPDRGPFAGLDRGRPRARIEAFWLALPDPGPRAPASGVVALRPPLERRIRVTGARFTMGSSASEMLAATRLCEKETFGVRCESSERFWDAAPSLRAEGHVHAVTVSDFELDRTEVTVERYARCVSAGACVPPAFPSGDPRFDRPTLPVTHVRWDDAVAYCGWVSGRLPTEAEWEHAARGGAGRTFPWGDLYNPHLSNHGAWADDPTDGRDGFVGLAPVGSFPDGATPTGLLDMAGNAAEWVHDFYDRDEEGYGYGRGAQVNPKGVPFAQYGHVVRGGSYREPAYRLRNASRFAWVFPSREIGFRCAYDIAGTAPAGPPPGPSVTPPR